MKKIIGLTLALAAPFAMADKDDWRHALDVRTVSLEEAIEIAENYTEARAYEIELDYSSDHKRAEYDVVLFSGNEKHEVEINAQNGEVIKSKREREYEKEDLIDEEALTLQAVIEKARAVNEAPIVEIEYEREHRGDYYEVRFYAPKEVSAELILDAKTGEIVRFKDKK